MRTLIKGKHLEGWTMLPAKEGTCEHCATAHEASLPHNQQSIFYQYTFYNLNGRWPTWEDAMAHCEPEMQEQWWKGLAEHGIKRPAAKRKRKNEAKKNK